MVHMLVAEKMRPEMLSYSEKQAVKLHKKEQQYNQFSYKLNSYSDKKKIIE